MEWFLILPHTIFYSIVLLSLLSLILLVQFMAEKSFPLLGNWTRVTLSKVATATTWILTYFTIEPEWRCRKLQQPQPGYSLTSQLNLSDAVEGCNSHNLDTHLLHKGITVRLTLRLTGLDLTKQILIQLASSVQSSRSQTNKTGCQPYIDISPYTETLSLSY